MRKFFLVFLLPLFLIGSGFPFFARAQVRNAIAIRVMANPEHLSPLLWYLENAPHPGRPRSLLVDGYEAVQDGRTIYVGAANVDTTNHKIYTNIYIISYDQHATPALIKIFGQIVKNWHFNSNIVNLRVCKLKKDGKYIKCSSDFDCFVNGVNYGPCLAPKDKIRRDVKRLSDINSLRLALSQYAWQHHSFPTLKEGTYLARKSVSRWPSWQQALGRELGTTLPVDPLNRFYLDCSEFPGYSAETCWNSILKKFQCPSGSYVYTYSAEGVCSQHCSSTNPSADKLCTKNSECDTSHGEYCMKTNAVATIGFHLEPIKIGGKDYSFNNIASFASVVSTSSPCSSYSVTTTPVLTNLQCCAPVTCASLGYSCGTYTNSCGETVSCGTCPAPQKCIDGACCTPNCAGKECGSDGCGGSCGTCPAGDVCNASFQCVPGCTSTCSVEGESKCVGATIPGFPNDTYQVQKCGYYTSNECLTWGPIQDCPAPYVCGINDGKCGLDADGDGYTSALTGGTDADDSDPTVYPGAPELCDCKDNNENGVIDEGCCLFTTNGIGVASTTLPCTLYPPSITSCP